MNKYQTTIQLMKVSQFFIIGFFFFLLNSCQESSQKSTLDQSDRTRMFTEVETAAWAFHEADTSMNADAVIGLLWPDCKMLIDGQRISYEDVSKGSKQFMSELVLFHAEWTDLQIIPVSEGAAIASFIFKDSIVNKAGEIIESQGPNTFLWQKRNDEWKILYVDADHYPVNLNN